MKYICNQITFKDAGSSGSYSKKKLMFKPSATKAKDLVTLVYLL